MVNVETRDRYLRFATAEARGQSACYEAWAVGVAEDHRLVDLIEELPEAKRQPNLVFGAARFVGIRPGAFEEFRAELMSQWAQVREVALAKRTQTNEVGRSAVLLPVLAALPQPLALLEVGASAGLCLYPDRFSYQYGDRSRLDPRAGPGPLLECAVEGPVPVPAAVPEVVWRAGIDVNPLDVTNAEDVRWLESLIWPEQSHRRERLSAAVSIARDQPPLLVRGDVNDTVEEMMAKAPSDATLVVFHSAVLPYLDRDARDAFVWKMRRADAHWVSNEAPGAIAMADGSLPESPEPSKALFVVAHDGEPLAYADGHGQALYWLR